MSLYSDPEFWFVAVLLFALIIGIWILIRQTRLGSQDAVGELQTVCHYCGEGFDPEKSEAPAHYRYYHCSRRCYEQALATGRVRK